MGHSRTRSFTTFLKLWFAAVQRYFHEVRTGWIAEFPICCHARSCSCQSVRAIATPWSRVNSHFVAVFWWHAMQVLLNVKLQFISQVISAQWRQFLLWTWCKVLISVTKSDLLIMIPRSTHCDCTGYGSRTLTIQFCFNHTFLSLLTSSPTISSSWYLPIAWISRCLHLWKACETDGIGQGSPNFFVRGPHKLLLNSPRAT